MISVGLGIALVMLNQKHVAERVQAQGKIVKLSNDVVSTQSRLDEQHVVNLTLESNLAAVKVESSNKLASVEASLSQANSDLAQAREQAKAAAETAANQLTERDKKIADLENQNQQLDKTSIDLRSAISTLENQIAVTKKKLADSEGDRDVLQKELKRLMAQKADLERKFNDLALLKEQVRKLKGELAVSRQLDFIRREIYATFEDSAPKGLSQPHAVTPTNASLNVELRQNGGASVVNPTNSSAK
jgi:chromosome segregation ATPase